jgi:hypothetical protein
VTNEATCSFCGRPTVAAGPDDGVNGVTCGAHWPGSGSECRAVAAALRRGAEAERKAVVAWLRLLGELRPAHGVDLACCVMDGEHRKEGA